MSDQTQTTDPHSYYGPCDMLMPDGSCAECEAQRVGYRRPAPAWTDLTLELAWTICAHHGDNANYDGPGECRRCGPDPDGKGMAGCIFLAGRAADAVLKKIRERRAYLRSPSPIRASDTPERTTDDEAAEEMAEGLFRAYWKATYGGVYSGGHARWLEIHDDTRMGWRAAAVFVLANENTSVERAWDIDDALRRIARMAVSSDDKITRATLVTAIGIAKEALRD
jgi:hypothetical protein